MKGITGLWGSRRVPGEHEHTQHLNRLLRALGAINPALLRAETDAQLFASICQILVEQGGYALAWVGLAEPGTQRVRVACQTGFAPEYLEELDIRYDDSPQGQGPTGTAIRFGKTVITEDTESDLRFAPWRERARQHGYRSTVAIPLRIQGQVTGSLNVYAALPHAFGDDEVLLLEKLTGDVGMALERMYAIARIEASERELATILRNMQDTYYRTDNDGRIVRASESATKLLGYTPQDMLGMRLADLYVEAGGRERFLAALQAAGGRLPSYEAALRHRDGSVLWVSTSAQYVRDGDGRVIGVEGTVRDITERRRAEQALYASEARYRNIVEAAHEGIWQIDADSRTVFVNRKMAEILGYTVAEMHGRSIFDFMDDEGRMLAEDNVERRKQGIAEQHEFKFRRKDGSEVWAELTANPLLDSTGAYTGALAMVTDVTTRRSADQALRASEARYRSTLEAMAEGIVVQDATGQILSCNPAAERILGLSRDQIMGRTSLDPRWRAVHDDGSPFPGDSHPAMVTLRTGAPQSNVIMGVHKPDGSLGWISINSQPLIGPGESGMHAVVTSFHDITSLRAATAALTASEARMAKAEEVARLGSWELDLTSNRLIWSDEVYRIFEMDPTKFRATYEAFVGAIHPEDREAVARAYDDSVRNRTPYEIVHRLRMPDGRVKHVQERCETTYDERGRALRSVGTVQDITERQRAEERATHLNRLLRTITEIDEMVVRERSRERLLAETCRILVAHGGHHMAWIGLADWAAGRVQPVAHAGFEDGYLEHADVRCDDSASGPTGTAIRENRRVICNNVESDPEFAFWRERASELGFRASAAFPLHVGGRVIGAVSVYASQPEAFGAEEVAMLDELVDNLGYALQGLEVAAALAQSEHNFRSLIQDANVGILVNHRGQHVFCNDALLAMLGYTMEQLRATEIKELVHPTEREKVVNRFHDRMAGKPVPSVYETVLVTPEGQSVPVEVTATRTTWQGEPAGLIFLQDLRERRRAEAQMRKLSSALEQTADTVMITNRAGVIEYVNPAFEHITGYSRAAAIGQTPRLVKSGKQGLAFYQKLWQTILAGEVFSDVFINRRHDGSLYYEEKTITPIKDIDGRITHFVATGKDVTERVHTEERLQHMAQHDALTELPNRVLLIDRLKQSLARARWHRRLVAVLFVDLDRFKTINDTLGHDTGDRLLQQLAERFGRCVRDGDTVARFGGDEFVILLDDVASDNDVGGIAQKALDVLAAPFTVDAQSLFITASIGISLYPADGEDSGTLLKNADIAMYRAKDLGKNTYQFYSSDMSARAFERLSLETSLRRALERHEFLLHYQPQVDSASGRIVGVEALIRWRHPELGIVTPADFIPLLEETGLIVPAGEWVLETACQQLRAWHDAGWPELRLAVNLSPRQFRAAGLNAMIERSLGCIGRDPGLLELEITESVILHHTRGALDTLEALRALGVRLAVDDFGTGYSSLSYLRRFPIDTLKVDRSFVQDIPGDANDCAITAAIIVLAQTLNLNVIAEGVENEAQREFLRHQGCQLMQGYLFSRPLPAEEITRLLERQG